jgi:hypothetical protein
MSQQKREYIKTHIYRLGSELSPALLFRVTTKDSHRYESEGWDEVLMTFRHQGEDVHIRYTGIRTERVQNAPKNRDSETKKTEGINSFAKAFRQAFSFFR